MLLSKCFNRKECLGLVMLIIGGLALWNYYLFDFFPAMHEMNIFEHQVFSACLSFISLYMGVAAFLLTPKNEFARTFLRLFHVFVYSVLLYFLFSTRYKYYIVYSHKIHNWCDHDILDDEDQIMALSSRILHIILILSGFIIGTNAYMIYARAVQAIATRHRPT